MLASLALSVVGALVAVCIRHYTSDNWTPEIRDIWYFGFSAGISVMMGVLGFDTTAILATTTGINTPIAILKSGIDKYTLRNGNVKLKNASLDDIKKEITSRGG